MHSTVNCGSTGSFLLVMQLGFPHFTMPLTTSGMEDVLVVPTDVTEPEEVRRMVRTVRQHFGRLDVLINNAGQGMYRPIEAIAVEDLQHLIEVNLYGPLVAMQEAIPIMNSRRREVA